MDSSSTPIGSGRVDSNVQGYKSDYSLMTTIDKKTTTSKNVRQSAAVNASTSMAGIMGQDMPPDMAVLLKKLEEDFLVNKSIDQWTYINKREQIMQSVNKLHEKQQNTIPVSPEKLQKPLKPRITLENFKDSDKNILLHILAARSKLYKAENAFLVLDSKGKDSSAITWEKLYLKSLKVAYEIKHKLSPRNNETVVLLYKDGELVEFTIALFGCFIAGVTAIPIQQDISLHEVLDIISLTSSRLLLYSEPVAKELDKLNSPTSNLHWPPKLEKWKTTDLGSAKKSEIAFWENKANKIVRPDLAYVEFSRSPIGELRGIAISHRTIQHQMNCLNTTLSSMPNSGGPLQRSYNEYRRERKVVLATLDIRFSIGLILGILFNVFGGNLLIWAPQRVMEVQGLYANIISRVRASLLLADYIGLKRVTYDYQKSPNSTRYYSKTQRVDFSSVKWALVNALTIDGEFMEILAHRYLRPLGCQHPENAVIPMLTLSEYGGMVISLRDWLGGKVKSDSKENTADDGTTNELSSLLIDKEALSRNIIKVVDTNPSSSDETSADTIRVDAFGYPLPDSTLAVVNPESSVLACKGELGEIWIDSPCLSGGFYGLKKESKSIFHAKCKDANSTLEMDFLRTGLLGFVYKGKLFILGLYEDRIRQRVSWLDQKLYRKLNKELVVGNGHKYHYVSSLLATLASEVRQIYDCTIFDVFLGNEYLPVAIVESEVVRRNIDDSGADSNGSGSSKGKGKNGESIVDSSQNVVPLNEPMLNVIAQRCFDALYRRHGLRLYCVVVVDCDTLPKIMRSGGLEIANMLCKKKFLDGSLRADFVKFFVEKSISMIPYGEDVFGGIWSPYISELRSASLSNAPDQYSLVDYREKAIDDKTGAPLTDFKTIIDILKFQVARNGDQIAFQNHDHNNKSSSKPLTWKKFELRVYAVCSYLIDKSMVGPGKHIMLMYSLSEEFVIALYACFFCGVIPVPMLPFDSNRIGEDYPGFVGILRDFDIQAILVNEDVEKFLKNGPVADLLKKMLSKRPRPLKIKNTGKLTKVSNVASLNSKIAKCQATANFRDPSVTALVWLTFTSDHYRVGATLSHKNILGICKTFKETCNLTSKSAIVGCVRHSSGIGFVQAALLGVYLGTTTYLCSPVVYAENPLSLFTTLSQLKVKDVFVTEQMLKYAAIKISPKGFNLGHMKNMMISTEGRVEPDFLRKFAKFLQPTKLSGSAMSMIYNCSFNPMVSTRSYMSVAPVDLYLDPVALRQGLVIIVNQVDVPNALHIQDSGMVPICTQIAIVNPETNKICKEGEFGEIWVSSEANLKSFTNGPKGPVDQLSNVQFNGKIVGGDPNQTYLRTGDLGFLHHISVTRSDSQAGLGNDDLASFQPLFVLGKISDTFEVMGLHHFAIDIEHTIESCHTDIHRNGSCIFKCAEYTVVLIESKRSRYLASLVPLIVNIVFSKHHIVVDIVAFIKKGEFPISRLGTKQRARIVDAWVQGVIPIVVSYGVNYGENGMIKLIKDMEEVVKSDPTIETQNPALSFYDFDIDLQGGVFEGNATTLTLNEDEKSIDSNRKAVFSVSNISSSSDNS